MGDRMLNYYEIGQRMRVRRRALGLSQEQLAEYADISITHMSHIETGSTKLSLPVLVFLAGSLHVSVDELLFDRSALQDAQPSRRLTLLLESCSAEELSFLTKVTEGVLKAMREP